MENYEIEKHLTDFKTRITELKDAIHLEKVMEDAKSIEETSALADFYLDQAKSQAALKTLKRDNDIIASSKKLDEALEELELYYEMRKDGEGTLDQEITSAITTIEDDLSAFELSMLLSHEYDMNDCIVELHAGAGGTEAMDWTAMLYRMYLRYAERNGFKAEAIDVQDGDEAGLKSVTFQVSGPYAYGYLKGEQGVHRLIRISPFDSNARRHTSFAACHVTPVVADDASVDIRPEDIRVDTYRSSGAGGQYINKTESAIRITHLATGIVVSCQTQRSQIQNREVAMNVLRAKLAQLKHEEQEKKLAALTGAVADNAFGSQIRTYTLQPYQQVKDHRTKYETGATAAVLDGEIGGFINAYLKSPYNKN